LSNADNHGEGKMLYHTQDSADAPFLVWCWDYQARIDGYNYGRDIFDNRNNLYRNDKSYMNCCT
jgi:hypothetical protein